MNSEPNAYFDIPFTDWLGRRSLLSRATIAVAVWLKRFSPQSLAVCVSLMVGLIGTADYVTDPDVSFSAIYLFPIAIAAWFLGGWFAFVLSVISVVLWLVGDIHGHLYDSAVVPLWNGILRLVFYMVVVTLLGELRKFQANLEIRAEEKARALTAEIAARENLESELLRISEREQRRFGQDIHDSLCQHLTATALTGQVLSERLARRGDPEAARAARLVELIEEGIELSRDLARGLNPVEMRACGLMESLEQFAVTTSELFGIDCRFECDDPVPFNDGDTAIHVYRIAQEAVSNAIKHGKARSVVIRLEVSEMGKILKVTDDGIGFRLPHGNATGMGLRIMGYRARIVGGHLDISPEPGRGTRIICRVPDIRLSHA